MAEQTIADLHSIYKSNINPQLVEVLAGQLGVTADSLNKLEVGINPAAQSWTFPERDAKGNIIGILQRQLDGKKLMVKGSKRGLIYTANTEGENYVSGSHNWTRVSDELPCPLCGKSDGCMLPTGKESNPPAVVCVHIAEGATKRLSLGYLHILDPKRNISRRSLLPVSSSPVVVVEGASDTLAAMDLGFTAVGRPSAEGGIDLLKGLLTGKTVIVVGDNDAGAGKSGMDSVFHNLKDKCKSVIKILPPEQFKDLRQWKNDIGLTKEQFLKYAEQVGDNSESPNIFEDEVAHTIAKDWLRQEKTKDSHLILRNYRGEYCEFRNNCYEVLETEEFRGQLYRFLDNKQYYRANTKGELQIAPYKPTRAKVNDIIDALNQWCPIIEDPPVWLEKNGYPEPVDLIAFQNGILDVNEYINGKIKMYNPTPDLFTFDVLPYDFDEDKESKIWTDFLEDIYNGEESKIKLLSQWFGYNCVPDLSFEKLMLFTGNSRSGKSTVLGAMQSMLGEKQCCETSFQSLAGSFGYQPLLGKFAAVIGDAKMPSSGSREAILEKILHITGGDAVSVNRKGIRELPMVHLKCRFTIAMTELPEFTDHARALEPRLCILVFENSYVGREDRTLKRRLGKEAREGRLINFALRGLKDLRLTKNFVEPVSSIETLRQFTELTTPITIFIAECCEFEPPRQDGSPATYFVTKDQLYDVWSVWCNKRGRKPGLKEQFCRWVTSGCSQIVTSRLREGKKREYVFNGIRLAPWVFQEFIIK